MRISQDEWGLRLAEATALRGTCIRRQVGCVLVDANGHVLATGYNGVPRTMPHCNEVTSHRHLEFPKGVEIDVTRPLADQATRMTPIYGNSCLAAGAPSGTALEGCLAVHAEINALIQCREADLVHVVYVTASPCVDCVKALMNTDCRTIVFREEYPHPEARARWRSRYGEHGWYHKKDDA